MVLESSIPFLPSPRARRASLTALWSANMTPETFRAIRESADIDRQELADIILFSPATGAKTVKEFETGRRPITGPVCVIMRLVQHGYLEAVIAASEAEDVVRMAGVEPARPEFKP